MKNGLVLFWTKLFIYNYFYHRYNILSTSTTLCQTYAEVLKRFGINSHQGNLEQQPNCTGEDFLHCLTSSKYSEQSLSRLSDSDSHLSNTNTSSTTQHEHYTPDVQPGSNCDNPSPSAEHQSLHVNVLAYLKDHNLHVGKGGYEKGLTPVPGTWVFEYQKFLTKFYLTSDFFLRYAFLVFQG